MYFCSSFASFANKALPIDGGTIKAVVSKDFGGDFLVLVLNSSDDVSMEGDRCATLSESDFPIILLEEYFEASSGEIRITDWINYREEGTQSWRSYTDTYSQSKAARVGSKNSGNASTVTWLITKGVNLETTATEFLSFETSNSFSNGSNLEVLISLNWDGIGDNITTATWDVLPAKIVADGENFKNWVHSTFINLSNYSGTAFIAFKFTGTGNINFDGTFELDTIKINAR
ncbi:choice-of-anchor J domain-containing protein [Polaribacter sp.]|uniref:choice-of-anchor J domain-containing protein n=1 Tax=Polaribacter sp. TaxID=1920175 RepID=UPI003ACF3B8A